MKLDSSIKIRKYYIFRGIPGNNKNMMIVSGIEPKELIKRILMEEICEQAEVFYGASVDKEEEITIFGIPVTKYNVGYSYDNCGGMSYFFVHEVKDNLKEIVRYPS